MNILKRTLAGLLVVYLAFGQVTVIPGNWIQGFSNLITIGAIPYVSAPGTLSQDTPAIHWDATNNRLGLGTASPQAAFHTVGGSSYGQWRLSPTALNGETSLGFFNDTAGTTTATAWVLGKSIWSTGNQFGLGYAGNTGTEVMWTCTTGGACGFGRGNTSPAGTLHVYDATATTGSTLLTIARGAGQTAASTVLTMNGVPQFAGTNTTGAGSALLGTNSPATTNTEPYTWIRIVTSDGSTAYIPAWK